MPQPLKHKKMQQPESYEKAIPVSESVSNQVTHTHQPDTTSISIHNYYDIIYVNKLKKRVQDGVPHNLETIFYKLNPLGYESFWPMAYRPAIKIIVNLWQKLLYSLVDQDKEKNTFMTSYATKTSELLCKQNWDQNLWVLLCENISDMIKDDEQYKGIIQVIRQSALREKKRYAGRSLNIASQLQLRLQLQLIVNPWFNLCKNILPLLMCEYQRCRVILFFIAMAAKEQLYILKQTKNKRPAAANNKLCQTGNEKTLIQKKEFISMKPILMTSKCWKRLCQVIKLLKKKRKILRDLSNAVEIGISKAPIIEDNVTLNEDWKEREVARAPGVDACTPTASETNKLKQEHDATTDTKDTDTDAVSTDIKVKIEPNLKNCAGDTQAENFASTELLNINAIKKEENSDKEEKKDFAPFVPKLIKVKKEESFEDTASMTKREQNQNMQNNQTSQIKEQPSLDKLILDFSFQQLNKVNSTVLFNEDCIIDISEDEDCIVHEDSKLEVSQLLNIYRDVISDNPRSMVRNLQAEQTECMEENNQMEKPKQSFDKSQEHNVVLPNSSSINVTGRTPSTSSSTPSKSNKMNATMSSKKLQNQIKRSRSKTNASVKKLFEQLRNESLASNSAAENTVINLDDTVKPKKRNSSPIRGKQQNKRKRYFNKIIPHDNICSPVIPVTGNNSATLRKPCPVDCSTPIRNLTNNANQDFIPIRNIRNNIIPITQIAKTKFNNNTVTTQNLNDEITDLTKEINSDSYLTIDLTTESLNCSSISKAQNTVIELDNTIDNADCSVIDNTIDNADCSVISVDNNNLSVSGESDVTVLNMSQARKERQMLKFAQGISKLDASEKGRLLELITQNIFNGCNVLDRNNVDLHNAPTETSNRATATAEDTYIKEVILGQTASRNSIGSNIYNPEKDVKHKSGLRMIVIDGSNVAMEHSRGAVFSVKALKICIDYFLKRGHVVKAFVPRFRCKFGKSTEPRLLDDLERRGLVIYTPSREIQGRMITSYDDRYIVQCAAEFDGVIVSGDNYRDLMLENPRWRFVIENRLLPFTWVNDMIMFPRDPLGRTGPTLEQFLRHPPAQQ